MHEIFQKIPIAPPIAIIAAMDEGRVIGHQGQMPWHLPADLKHFRQVTWGKPIMMGRKTYASIGRALDGRLNIVLSRDRGLTLPGCVVVHSLEAAFVAACEGNPTEVMVIGGGHLYEQMLPWASRLYLTQIQHRFTGDTHFPPWQADQWQVVKEQAHLADEKNPYAYRFVTLQRVNLNIQVNSENGE